MIDEDFKKKFNKEFNGFLEYIDCKECSFHRNEIIKHIKNNHGK